MTTSKRAHDGTMKEMTAKHSTSSFMPMFEMFRNDLDEHHDRRERVIKASRDITALSKKMIFSLQRARWLGSIIDSRIIAEVEKQKKAINDLFELVGPDLHDINAWRYQRQISGGVQEYTEAISFEHYLKWQTLIPHELMQDEFKGGVVLTWDDYVLGLFDLVGEVMRFAITSLATNGALPEPNPELKGDAQVDLVAALGMEDRDLLLDLRMLRSHFEAVNMGESSLGRDAAKKMEVMKTCVEKVENAVYGMKIRGRERPKGWVPDLREEERRAEPVESY